MIKLHANKQLTLQGKMGTLLTCSIDTAGLCGDVDLVSLLQKIKFEGVFVEQLTMNVRTIAQDIKVVWPLSIPILSFSQSTHFSSSLLHARHCAFCCRDSRAKRSNGRGKQVPWWERKVQGLLHRSATCASQKTPPLGLTPCRHCLEVLSDFEQKALHFRFILKATNYIAEAHKLYSRSGTMLQCEIGRLLHLDMEDLGRHPGGTDIYIAI